MIIKFLFFRKTEWLWMNKGHKLYPATSGWVANLHHLGWTCFERLLDVGRWRVSLDDVIVCWQQILKKSKCVFISCAAFGGPLVFHTNNGLKVKFTARFRKMFNSKTKKPLDSIRREKCGAHFKGFTFSCLRKVKDSPLALRAFISHWYCLQSV